MENSYGKNGQIVRLEFPNAYNGYVISDKNPNEAISHTGVHYGFMYKGIVHCVVYPEGKLYEDWINSFSAVDCNGKIIEPIVTFM